MPVHATQKYKRFSTQCVPRRRPNTALSSSGGWFGEVFHKPGPVDAVSNGHLSCSLGLAFPDPKPLHTPAVLGPIPKSTSV